MRILTSTSGPIWDPHFEIPNLVENLDRGLALHKPSELLTELRRNSIELSLSWVALLGAGLVLGADHVAAVPGAQCPGIRRISP